MMKSPGYSTAAIGKWHLGHLAPFLPLNQGFNYYFGIPYSNDMGHNNYDRSLPDFISGPTPILRNNEVIEVDPDQRLLTRRFTDEVINFITNHKNDTFFIYLAHSMPHVTTASSPHFEGTSDYGPYGDAVEEIDWGQASCRERGWNSVIGGSLKEKTRNRYR